jgi:Phasin protein
MELNSMATKNDDQPGGKRRQRSRKSDRRVAKGDQPQTAASISRQDHQQEDQTPPIAALTEVAANDRIEPAEIPANDPAEPAEILANGVAEPVEVRANGATEPVEVLANSVAEAAEAAESGLGRLPEIPLIGEVIPPDAPSAGSGRPTEGFPVTVAAIAMAYGDYARRSFQENRSFVERLMGVRSFEQAIEVQTEFARVAYANFVAESQKICELYGEFARQIFRPFGFATMITQFRRQIS